MQLRLDVFLLCLGYALDMDIVEYQLRKALLVGFPAGIQLFQGHFAGNTFLDGVDQGDGLVVADLHKLSGLLEIEERDIREIKLDHHAIRLVDTIVRLLHDHGLQLVVWV